jgi:hypothetical protein
MLQLIKDRTTLSVPLKVSFFLLLHFLFDRWSYSKKYINIIYFVMTYFINKDTLIMIYLFYYLHKNLDEQSNKKSKSKKQHI